MKNQYEKPVMVAETFTPNNFVSTCDWWKAIASGLSSATYYHDDGDKTVESGEDFTINSPSEFYFKLSDSSTYITQNADGRPTALSNNVNNDNNYYTKYYSHAHDYVYVLPNGTHSRYTSPIYKIEGYLSKNSSSKSTYWYTSPNLAFTKSAS